METSPDMIRKAQNKLRRLGRSDHSNSPGTATASTAETSATRATVPTLQSVYPLCLATQINWTLPLRPQTS